MKNPRASESRRAEARRQRSEQRGSLWRRLRARIPPAAMAAGAGFYVLTLLVQFWGSESMPWARDEQVERDITARVDFEFEDQYETKQKRQQARASAANVFVADPEPVKRIRAELQQLRELAVAAGGDAAKLTEQARARGWSMNEGTARALQAYASNERQKDYAALVEKLLERLGRAYIAGKPEDPNRKTLPPRAILRGEAGAMEVDGAELLYVTERQAVQKVVNEAVAGVKECPESLRGLVSEVVGRVLVPADAAMPALPLWRYSAEATAEEMERAAGRVEPYVRAYKEGAVLVEAGTVLGLSELELLRREHEQFIEAQKTVPELRQKHLLTEFGLAVVILMVSFGLGLYTSHYHPRILANPARALGLASLMLSMIVLSRVVERTQYPWDLPPEASTFFVVTAAALLAIAYDQRFALGAGAALAALVTLTSRGDLGLLLTFLAAMAVTVLSLSEVRTRGKLIGVGAAAGVAAMVASAAMGFVGGQAVRYIVIKAVVAGSVALFAGFFVQGILHYFERMFGVATSMTLLEWCDASRPLLRRLAQEAPGTYSHSLVLSLMAEAAAEAIGGRGLLARVGALYHDIGKAQKAAYFVENQEARMSRHAGLSPTMSLLIIVGHVKDGIELARAYGLPRILHQFIAEHHGTTMVKYFHHAAAEAAAKNHRTKGRHDREVPESEFRYPGPKPRLRESAILMICDSCEGAVRALDEPTPGRIESTVHQVVMDRLNDGQFDDCDITLRELRLVEDALVKSLCAIHHGRIKYPKGPPEKERRAEAEREGEEPVEAGQTAPEVAQQA